MANGIDVGKAYVQIIPSADGIAGSISSILNDEAESAGLSAGTKVSGGVGKALKVGLGTTAAVAGIAVAGVSAVGGAITSTAKDTAAYGDNIDKLSQKIGISAEAFQEWDYVFSQSGTDIGVLQTGMKTLRNAMDNLGDSTGEAVVDQAKLQEAQLKYQNKLLDVENAQNAYNAAVAKSGEGSDEAQKALIKLQKAQNDAELAMSKVEAAAAGETKQLSDAGAALLELGVSATDANGELRDEEEVFADVITALQGMENETERARLASLLLGKGGTELGALLNTSAEDTQALKDQIHELGGVMSDDAVKNAAAFTDAQDNLSRAMDGVKNQIGASFLPAFTDIANGFAELIAGNDDAVDKISQGFAGIADNIAEATPGILDTFTGIIEAIAPIAPELITTLATGILDALPELMPVAVDIITQLTQTLIDNLPLIIDTGVQLLLMLVLGIADALPELIPAAVDAILTIVDALLDNIDLLVDAAIKLTIGIAEGLIKALPKLIEKAPIIISKLVSALVTNIPKLIAAGWDLIKGLAEGILKMIPELATIGWNLVMGLIDGLAQGWDRLWDWLTSVCGNLIEHIKNMFGVASPSKVFAQIGAYCVEGFDNAFDDFGEKAISDVEGVMDELEAIPVPELGADISLNGGFLTNASRGGIDVGGISISIVQRDDQDAYQLAQVVSDMINNEMYKVGAAYA